MPKFWCSFAMFFAIVAIHAQGALALGCMRTICSNDARQFQNQIRACTSDGICGEYKSLRRNNQYLEAVELTCNEGTYVYAPFDGELSYYQPFGGAQNAQCADQGARIDGSGQWRGYYVLISTVKLYRLGGRVRAGDKLGVAGNLECFEESRAAASSALVAAFSSSRRLPKNYVRVALFREGRAIDPTYHLVDCMCVGQLCETNGNNALLGAPFKHDSRYNGVRGWELKCPLIADFAADEDANDSDESSAAIAAADSPRRQRAPKVYSPIDGSVVGRIRLDFAGGTYGGCANEGLFIVGSGKWTDYEVRLYNVRFVETLGVGVKNIHQGQHIADRLTCGDAGSRPAAPDSVFVEVRFQGVPVDVSDAISAKFCQHKKLGRLFRF